MGGGTGTGFDAGDRFDAPAHTTLFKRSIAQISRKKSELNLFPYLPYLSVQSCSSRKIWQCSLSSRGSRRASRYRHVLSWVGLLAAVDLLTAKSFAVTKDAREVKSLDVESASMSPSALGATYQDLESFQVFRLTRWMDRHREARTGKEVAPPDNEAHLHMRKPRPHLSGRSPQCHSLLPDSRWTRSIIKCSLLTAGR